MGKKKNKKSKFFKNVWAIVKNENDTQDTYTKSTLISLTSLTLNIISLLMFFVSIAGVIILFINLCNADWNTFTQWFSNIISVLVLGVIFVFSFLFSIILKGFANEVEQEQDKNYIVSIFSGVTGFAALIIALIALYRG